MNTKAAQTPENKQAPAPQNKGVEAAARQERRALRTIAKEKR